MSKSFRNILVALLLSIFFLANPGLAQSATSDQLDQKIQKLTLLLNRLKAEKGWLNNKSDSHFLDYSVRDSLQLINLKRKQADSRARIDALTLDLIRLSRQLEDPRTRYALAKRLQQPATPSGPHSTKSADSSSTLAVISARSIDLAAMPLIRQGKTLDQARLSIIEALSPTQVLAFYQQLPQTARYGLYDLADELASSEQVDLTAARRSAIYYYLYAR